MFFLGGRMPLRRVRAVLEKAKGISPGGRIFLGGRMPLVRTPQYERRPVHGAIESGMPKKSVHLFLKKALIKWTSTTKAFGFGAFAAQGAV